MEYHTNNLAFLKKKYAFELIPDCPAATAAGYTDADRNSSQVLTGPIIDENNFYYSAFNGGTFDNSVKSSILVCRKKVDGQLVYCINCNDYNLDTGINIAGPVRTPCRALPVIVDDKLYLNSGFLTNIGPQVFCINKHTGQLIYAIAYYLPKEVEDFYGTTFLTTRANYSQFFGSNARVNTCNSVIKKNPKTGTIHIFAGCSSLQNVPTFNPGLVPGSIHFTGYPFYTDQGVLTRIDEIDGVPSLGARTFTCAKNLNVGDILVKVGLGHPDSYKDPFPPGSNKVILTTLSKTLMKQPAFVNTGNPATSGYFFAQNITTNGGPINPNMFAPFWANIGSVITVDDGPSGLTFAQALAILQGLPAGSHVIWAKTDTDTNIVDTPATGQQLVWYTKKLYVGDSVDNVHDIQGLGYFGNDPWGGGSVLHEFKNCCGCKIKPLIYSTTGQTHHTPLDERLYFFQPEYNYRSLKEPLVDLTNAYAEFPSQATLDNLNQEKEKFGSIIRGQALTVSRSPRGQMSYCDAIFASSPNSMTMKFAARSTQSDVYIFLFTFDPLARFISGLNDVDGDCSGGVFAHESLISTISKSGVGMVLNIDNYSGGKWDHSYPASVGVNVEKFIYSGPNGLLGGDNYQITQDKSGLVFGNTSNTGFLDGSRGSTGQFEKFVSKDGLFVFPGIAITQAMSPDKNKIEWNSPLLGQASGAVTVVRKSLLTCDVSGHLYVLSTKTGAIKLIINSGTDTQPMNGGVASPVYDSSSDCIFWIAAYNIPAFPPGASKWGWVLCPDPDLKFPKKGCHKFLDGSVYSSQILLKDAINTWRVTQDDCCIYIVVLQYDNKSAIYLATFKSNIVEFELLSIDNLPSIKMVYGEFLTKNLYKVKYVTDQGSVDFAYFNKV